MKERYVRSINRFIYLFFFQFCSTLIPRPLQKFFCVVVGDLFYFLMRKTRANIRKNVKGVSRGNWSKGRVDFFTRKTFQNYGQYLLDYMVMHRLHPSNKARWVADKVGADYMVEALYAGKGAICITPHLELRKIPPPKFGERGVISLKHGRKKTIFITNGID